MPDSRLVFNHAFDVYLDSFIMYDNLIEALWKVKLHMNAGVLIQPIYFFLHIKPIFSYAL